MRSSFRETRSTEGRGQRSRHRAQSSTEQQGRGSTHPGLCSAGYGVISSAKPPEAGLRACGNTPLPVGKDNWDKETQSKRGKRDTEVIMSDEYSAVLTGGLSLKGGLFKNKKK